MTALVRTGTCGTPLHILSTVEFEPWLVKAPIHQQNWLKANQYSGKGPAVLPNGQGQLDCAILVVENKLALWNAGDLSKQLPAGDYLLNDSQAIMANVALAWLLGGYRFNRYKADDKPQARLVIDDKQLVTQAHFQASAVMLARDLINTPPADMMPEHLAKAMQQLANDHQADFSQIIGDELLDKGYPTIHMVGRASKHSPQLLDLRWGRADAPKVTLVGKGVCFDSGGLDIKPAAGMRQMKKDMGGAAHVLALAKLIMANQLDVQLRVLVPAVENAIAGNAFRPGDVVKTRSGLTVEIDNTDAEGRLILCDALTEADSEQPELLIDFATLTGACRVALGTELPGFWSSDDELAFSLVKHGKTVQDPVWPMPLYAPYKDMLKSDIADLSNCSPSPYGGAITAALYLQEFVSRDRQWLHFDVMAWNLRALPGRPIGGEAVAVRAVYSLLAERFGHSQ